MLGDGIEAMVGIMVSLGSIRVGIGSSVESAGGCQLGLGVSIRVRVVSIHGSCGCTDGRMDG